MLTHLTISDLAVVKALDLNLKHGMSVLTGETGAGKSILLTALGLALGDRADSGYIRPDCKRAEINLVFDLTDAVPAQHWLQQQALADGDTCVIRRVINQDGRSKAYINNHAVTLQALQQLSGKLVEIHGQHAHLTLLKTDEQRRLLDVFAKTQPLLDQVNACYHNWHTTDKELKRLVKASTDQSAREDLLRYQLDELQQLDLSRFNYAALSEQHSKLANFEHILTVGQSQVDALYEHDNSVCSQLSASVRELTDLARFAPELGAIGTLLTEAHIQTEEAALQLRRFLDAQDADPQRLDAVEQQLAVIQNLSRKHHVLPDELPAFAHKLATELDTLSHSSERIDSLTALVAQQLSDYRQLTAQLSAQRYQSSQLLQQHISAMIKELGMPQGEFLVAFFAADSDTPKLNGTDRVEFLVSANQGLPAKPLAKVASGGELSRISLAIQVTTSNDKTTPTMIFDEVDAGIGGGIAEIVGQKLRRLSHNRQVLCVTHLPQVAAQAHHHLYVEKNHETDITSSHVRLLTDDDRVEETARMLGGVNLTANTRSHAREMLVHALTDSPSV